MSFAERDAGAALEHLRGGALAVAFVGLEVLTVHAGRHRPGSRPERGVAVAGDGALADGPGRQTRDGGFGEQPVEVREAQRLHVGPRDSRDRDDEDLPYSARGGLGGRHGCRGAAHGPRAHEECRHDHHGGGTEEGPHVARIMPSGGRRSGAPAAPPGQVMPRCRVVRGTMGLRLPKARRCPSISRSTKTGRTVPASGTRRRSSTRPRPTRRVGFRLPRRCGGRGPGRCSRSCCCSPARCAFPRSSSRSSTPTRRSSPPRPRSSTRAAASTRTPPTASRRWCRTSTRRRSASSARARCGRCGSSRCSRSRSRG